MARVYHAADGSLLAFRRDDADLARNGAPAGAAGFIDFDPATNADAVAGLDGQLVGVRWQDHAVTGGQLRRQGVAVVLAADGSEKQEIDGLLNNAAQAVADNTTYLGLASPSAAQVAAQVRALTQQTSRIIRRLVRLNRLRG